MNEYAPQRDSPYGASRGMDLTLAGEAKSELGRDNEQSQGPERNNSIVLLCATEIALSGSNDRLFRSL
jgi:hypothetical protein